MARRRPDSVVKLLDPNTYAGITSTYSIVNEQGYPFSVMIDITYILNKDGFSITVSANNVNGDGSPLPFYVGWHPYFKCTAYSSTVTLDPCLKWNHVQMNYNKDPTGKTEATSMFDGSKPIGGSAGKPTLYDDEFKPRRGSMTCPVLKTTLFDKTTNQAVVLWQDDQFRFVQVFTGFTSETQEEAIAIEPMSAMADAYNNHDHLTVLSDGETWTGTFGVYVE